MPGTAPPLPRMPLAERLRAAGTRDLARSLLARSCSSGSRRSAPRTVGATNVGWRFEQGADAFASVQGAFRLVNGDLPREGSSILWPIVLSPFASVADTLDGVLAGVVLLNVLVLAPLALVSAYWIAARIGGGLLAVSTVALWVLGPWLLLLLVTGSIRPGRPRPRAAARPRSDSGARVPGRRRAGRVRRTDLDLA